MNSRKSPHGHYQLLPVVLSNHISLQYEQYHHYSATLSGHFQVDITSCLSQSSLTIIICAIDIDATVLLERCQNIIFCTKHNRHVSSTLGKPSCSFLAAVLRGVPPSLVSLSTLVSFCSSSQPVSKWPFDTEL